MWRCTELADGSQVQALNDQHLLKGRKVYLDRDRVIEIVGQAWRSIPEVGPLGKHPGWEIQALQRAKLPREHRYNRDTALQKANRSVIAVPQEESGLEPPPLTETGT